MRLFRCAHCGNTIVFVKESGVPVICCGEPMREILPGSVDASHEKHVPVAHTDGSMVTIEVGSAVHPMEEKHFIEWIVLESKKGRQRKTLKPGDAPKATFMLTKDDAPVAVYAYCNLHGLWKTDM